MDKRKDREGPIHRSIYHYLLAAHPRALVFHPANELNMGGNRQSKAIAQVKAKSLGMLPGVPDLIMLLDGTFYGFEVKAPGNYPTEAQRAVGDAIKANGGCWAVVRSIDDAQEAIDEFQALDGWSQVELRGTVR